MGLGSGSLASGPAPGCLLVVFDHECLDLALRQPWHSVRALPFLNNAFLEGPRWKAVRMLHRCLRVDALGLRRKIGLCQRIRRGKCSRPPPDAGGDRFLGARVFLPVSLGRGFNCVGSLDRLDLLGYFGNARPFLFPGSCVEPERPALSWSRKLVG